MTKIQTEDYIDYLEMKVIELNNEWKKAKQDVLDTSKLLVDSMELHDKKNELIEELLSLNAAMLEDLTD